MYTDSRTDDSRAAWRIGRLPCDAVAERSYPQRDYSRPPEAVEILLVRHGASQAVVDGQPFELLEGQADPSLSPEGEQQARAVAAFLAEKPLQALFVTPLCRTAQTAAPIAEATGLEAVVVPELREVHLGDLDGGAFRIALHAGDPVVREVFVQERWDVIPGAERMEDLAERTRAGIEWIVANVPAGATVAAVVHGGVIGELCRQATDSTRFSFVRADNGSITRLIVFPDGRWWVRSYNEVGHLPGLASQHGA
jgi:probable phosphoglycerate mutase